MSWPGVVDESGDEGGVGVEGGSFRFVGEVECLFVCGLAIVERAAVAVRTRVVVGANVPVVYAVRAVVSW